MTLCPSPACWLDPQPVNVPSDLAQAVGGHPILAEALVRRGILTPEAAHAFLDPAAYAPALPADLPDVDRAVERLRQAIYRRERIAIWGDFDADGQTATALLLETLRALGANVTFYVPGRDEGHGLHQAGLERLIAAGARLILTCDTGVTAHAAIDRVHRLGAEVIVTDHHTPADRLPAALAVINPHRLPPGHPLGTLTGVGVAYMLARALSPTVADRTLDLVALGTVADVGELTGDNRYLVQRGLEALRHTGRPGLLAVYEAAGLRPEGLTEEHIGYVLGPRLNALGRLADAADGVELLTTADLVRARTLATEVEGLNAQRQWLTKQVTDAALAQIDRDPALLNDYQALVLSSPTWPTGVIGIVAGRLAERFGKPVALIAARPGQVAWGSARSVPGVDLIAALGECAYLLKSFGGHAGAAGFSLEAEHIPELRAALSRAVAAPMEAAPPPTLIVDAYVELPDLTLDLVAQINRLAPFGRGNPPLILAVRDLRLLSEATIGRTGEHRRVTVEDADGRTQTVFWWQGADWPLPQGRFDLALTLRASDYRGLPEVQVEWLTARERQPDAGQVAISPPTIAVHDYRFADNAEAELHKLIAQGDIQVWAEGDGPRGVETRMRQQLTPGRRLAIWTLPPGPRELRAVLDRVQPAVVILFAHDPGLDEAEAFLQRLAGLVKYALQAKGGQVDLEAVAAHLAHRVGTVRAGLEWLAAVGQVVVVEQANNAWRLAPGSGQRDAPAIEAARARLDALLAETAAFRAYLRDLPAGNLAALLS